MTIKIKDWIYKKIQSDAFTKGKTIIWEKLLDYDDKGEEIELFSIKVNSVVKETEKAICYDCCYWYHGTYSQRVNFTEYTGYKVWIPKSAIA